MNYHNAYIYKFDNERELEEEKPYLRMNHKISDMSLRKSMSNISVLKQVENFYVCTLFMSLVWKEYI